MAAAGWTAALRLGGRRAVRMSAASLEDDGPKASFAIVGCGLPGRGMGWFHALQLVEASACPSARLSDVVEPWFLGGGKGTPAGAEFQEKVVEAWSGQGVAFHDTLSSNVWASAAPGTPRVALVAGRTVDNPRLFAEALAAGATHVLLEKPGAPTVEDLEVMKAHAAEAGVPVCIGFIKQLSPYFERALAAARAAPADADALVSLISSNDYTEANIGECFERNAEGLLKNMAIHELALVASEFGMTVDTVTDVAVDRANSDLRTIGAFTDFVKVDFTLTNRNGVRVRIVADRCGGNGCYARVTNGATGETIIETAMVDEAREAVLAKREAEHPDWLSYLLSQELEYAELKERVAAASLHDEKDNNNTPRGVATIDTAIDALKLAEYLTPKMTAELRAA